MTYPPQQQPDGWGQQPPPQEPWGQQPDQWGQQPPPPPPPQDPWGGGGYDGYGPPPKKGGGKTVAIVLVVLVVLAGAGVGLFFLLKDKGGEAAPGGMDPNDPKSVAVAWAELYARAYNSDYQDVKAEQLKPLMCASQHKDLDELQQEADEERQRASSASAVPAPGHRKYDLAIGEVKVNGDAATVMVTATPQAASSGGASGSAQSGPAGESRAFDMKKENGGWKVCGPQKNGGGGAPAPSGGANPPIPGSGGAGPVPSGSVKPLPSGIPMPTR